MGELHTGLRQSPLFSMVTKLVVVSNVTSFFGEELGKDYIITTKTKF
jgi:hypothetical protein